LNLYPNVKWRGVMGVRDVLAHFPSIKVLSHRMSAS
jgi:uncharacterized protein with HEPN domain